MIAAEAAQTGAETSNFKRFRQSIDAESNELGRQGGVSQDQGPVLKGAGAIRTGRLAEYRLYIYTE